MEKVALDFVDGISFEDKSILDILLKMFQNKEEPEVVDFWRNKIVLKGKIVDDIYKISAKVDLGVIPLKNEVMGSFLSSYAKRTIEALRVNGFFSGRIVKLETKNSYSVFMTELTDLELSRLTQLNIRDFIQQISRKQKAEEWLDAIVKFPIQEIEFKKDLDSVKTRLQFKGSISKKSSGDPVPRKTMTIGEAVQQKIVTIGEKNPFVWWLEENDTNEADPKCIIVSSDESWPSYHRIASENFEKSKGSVKYIWLNKN